MVEIRWHGRGGQGAFTAARLLGSAVSVMGDKYALAFPSFGPERRGAPVLSFTKIDSKPIRNRSQEGSYDYIVVLDESLMNPSIFQGIKPHGIVFVNAAHPKLVENSKGKIVAVPASDLAMKILQKPVVNVAMIAVLAAYTNIATLESCLKAIDLELKPNMRKRNKSLFEQMYFHMTRKEAL